MKLGVIGSEGFVGSVVCKELNAIGITRDNYSENIGKKFDVLINCDGNSSKWQANENPVYDFSANVESVYNSIYDFKFDKYVYISSYDAHKDNAYGFHKKLAETIVGYYTDYTILRCPIIIGKNMKKGFLHDALNDIPLYVNEDSKYRIITNTELAQTIKMFIDKKIEGLYYLGSKDFLRIGDLPKLINKKITYRDDSKYEDYSFDSYRISSILKLKTVEEHIGDIL
jgi:nucleoside-diphosphate-sugar epimerase